MGNASSDRPDLPDSAVEACDSITRDSTTETEKVKNNCDKIACSLHALDKRSVTQLCPSLACKRSVPPYGNDEIAEPRRLEKCPKEFDSTPRETKLALRTTDLASSLRRPSSACASHTNSDPAPIQHWALVVRFDEGEKTSVYEAVNENGLLQATRAIHVNHEVFSEAMYFAAVKTSPSQLLEKARNVPSNRTKYDAMNNNCQTWLEEYLNLISPKLWVLLNEKIKSFSAPSYRNDEIAKPKRLEECPKEFDSTPRGAKLALRTTNLTSWPSSLRNPSSACAFHTNSDPAPIQHWALVIRFDEGEKTSVYEAVNENGLLQATCAVHVNHAVFSEATYFADVKTSPKQLLEKARKVPSNRTKYDAMSNNCQTWLEEYLNLISPELWVLLNENIRLTIT